MTHFPPPPTLPPKVARFHRVPPAIFPAVLGLLGLVAAWRQAERHMGFPAEPVDVIFGMVTLLFVACAVSYAAKFILRPRVVMEDAATLPGRTGLAALALCLIVQAALLGGRFDALALICLGLGSVGLFLLVAWVLPKRLRGTDTAGPITAAMHLIFVGFILIPTAAVPIGLMMPAMPWLIGYCLIAALVITGLTIHPLLFATGAPPLRPLHAIQIAPPAFLATGAILIEQPALATAMLFWAGAVAVLLLLRLRWLIEGGFSGFWSAFTFPVTALAGAFLMGYGASGAGSLRFVGGIVLVASTLYIPVIAYKVLKLWATGALAAKTNAATV